MQSTHRIAQWYSCCRQYFLASDNRFSQYRSTTPLPIHWERIVEFLKLHYVLTKRDDTAFWRDNRDPATIPAELQQRLALWRHDPPAQQDFSHQPEVFSWPSYQYILHGMRYATHYTLMPRIESETPAAQRCFEAASRAKARLLAELPRHRDVLSRIRDYGLQAV